MIQVNLLKMHKDTCEVHFFHYIIWSIQKGGKYTTSSKQVHEFDCGCGCSWEMGNPLVQPRIQMGKELYLTIVVDYVTN